MHHFILLSGGVNRTNERLVGLLNKTGKLVLRVVFIIGVTLSMASPAINLSVTNAKAAWEYMLAHRRLCSTFLIDLQTMTEVYPVKAHSFL
jgi:hypothetical protein